MLRNGLGDLILREARFVRRIVDLFSGSGVVSWFAGENTTKPVLATDLQTYAVALANSVISREAPVGGAEVFESWFRQADRKRKRSEYWRKASSLSPSAGGIRKIVGESRELCTRNEDIGPIWNAYGGFYFSPVQALTIDALLDSLPEVEPQRTVCLAALMCAASRCVASPGHTAQPFQPSASTGPFIREAWDRDVAKLTGKALADIAPRYARTRGKAEKADAISMSATLSGEDLAIVDPPYSDVQYSRYYRVIETIASGRAVPVHGAGRYPPLRDRPQSDFSQKSKSGSALQALFKNLARVGSTVILTFPDQDCSNGLSGSEVVEMARAFFLVEHGTVNGRFSTLGGNNKARLSRKDVRELLLVMRPN